MKFEFNGRIKRIFLGNDSNDNSATSKVWTLQKIIDLLRGRFRDLNKELTVYENMSGTYKQLDTNELMKIINLSYLSFEEEQEEVDIDSNINL